VEDNGSALRSIEGQEEGFVLVLFMLLSLPPVSLVS